jgi:tRNA-Thr(GGU) m(6)t(6)A37 methyltransferase TsaA
MHTLTPIARIHNGFAQKFGVPRQSGLAEEVSSRIRFEPPYASPDAVRGLDAFSHLWLIWGFSMARQTGLSATVRPPRLGGNRRVGVFATRAPFRPNGLGLSSVRLGQIDWDAPGGPELIVLGADLADGTPIYDIKPYLPYTDSHPDARAGFAEDTLTYLAVEIPEETAACLPAEHMPAIRKLLSCDPRPSYQKDDQRVYGRAYAGYNSKFRVEGETLRVVAVEPI